MICSIGRVSGINVDWFVIYVAAAADVTELLLKLLLARRTAWKQDQTCLRA